jgi:hypothetical protein
MPFRYLGEATFASKNIANSVDARPICRYIVTPAE